MFAGAASSEGFDVTPYGLFFKGYVAVPRLVGTFEESRPGTAVRVHARLHTSAIALWAVLLMVCASPLLGALDLLRGIGEGGATAPSLRRRRSRSLACSLPVLLAMAAAYVVVTVVFWLVLERAQGELAEILKVAPA